MTGSEKDNGIRLAPRKEVKERANITSNKNLMIVDFMMISPFPGSAELVGNDIIYFLATNSHGLIRTPNLYFNRLRRTGWVCG